MQTLDVVILLELRIIPQFLMLMYTCDFLMYKKFLLFWHEGIFMVLMMVFVWYIKIMFKIFCITRKYHENMTQCLSCFLLDCIYLIVSCSHTLKSQMTQQMFSVGNSWLIFWNVFLIFVWFLTVCFFNLFLFLNLFHDFCLFISMS